MPRIVKFIETESSMVIARARGRREWKLLSNGYRVSVWDVGKIREVDGGAGCTTA